MIQQQKTKTKDTLSGKLTDGMTKMDRPTDAKKWTKEKKSKRKRKK